MSTEFQTLDKAKDGEKISFIGTVTHIGDLKSGTNNTGDYTYKKLTIEDATTITELTVWNDDIKKFVKGGKYEIINAYAKLYKEKLGLGIQYGTVKLIGTDKQQSTMDETPHQSATLDDKAQELEQQLKEKQAKLKEKSPTGLEEFTLKQNKLLTIISQIVYADLYNEHTTEKPRGDVVWVRTKEIYNLWSAKK